ncbi:MAG TPA: FtsX-like permease family protein, partial [Gemmatimonadales bacterium]|nr:FtsX-like permease family protein [Gemmatimonadales bacterium]
RAAVGEAVTERLRPFNRWLVAPRAITLDEFFDRAVLPQRILARAAAGIAAVQLLLAIAGLSGLVAYITALRRREIGIRRALGASGSSVVALVMRQGVRLTLAGIALGLALSLGVAQSIADALPVTAGIMAGGLSIAAAIFAIVGSAAMLLPALRTLAVEPASALKSE